LSLTFFGDTPREVVGIVGDVKQDGLDASTPSETIYYPLAQQPGPGMSLAVRAAADPSAIASEITKAVREIDPEQPVLDVISMDGILSTSLAQRRFTMLLLAAFAGLALLLAAVGIYSVLSYAVKRRTREIGIRMALGAQIGDVLRLIVAEGMKPTLIGLAIGIAGALALGRFLASLVYGVSATDVMTFASVSLLLLGVGLMASIVPAYRATKVEPVKTLREE
jgi:ABC-type antimicrobial peptide transport system permease subunit